MNRLRCILKESFNLPQPLKIDENCGWSNEGYFHANNFALWCQKNLGLQKLPHIKIVSHREGGMTTGAFDPSNDTIIVLGGGRALVDVMRTLAHELTHYRQRLQNRIKSTKEIGN